MLAKFPRWLRALIIAVAISDQASALEWNVTTVALTPKPLQSAVDATFIFTNRGTAPVAIGAIDTNCDCLSASVDKQTVAPGESGVLVARFTVGDRIGLYERSITVRSSDAPSPQRLQVRIEVPDLARVQPLNLVWLRGSSLESKAVEIHPADGTAIQFTEAFSTNDQFTVSLETIEPQRHYRAIVTPRSVPNIANAAIRFKGTTPDGRSVTVSAYANVR